MLQMYEYYFLKWVYLSLHNMEVIDTSKTEIGRRDLSPLESCIQGNLKLFDQETITVYKYFQPTKISIFSWWTWGIGRFIKTVRPSSKRFYKISKYSAPTCTLTGLSWMQISKYLVPCPYCEVKRKWINYHNAINLKSLNERKTNCIFWHKANWFVSQNFNYTYLWIIVFCNYKYAVYFFW